MPIVTRYATADRQIAGGTFGGGNWVAPENARAADEPSETNFSSVALTSNQESETRAFRNFALLVEDGGPIPVGATINSVTAEYRCQVALSTGALDNVTGTVDCSLWDDGTSVGAGSHSNTTVKTTSAWTTVSVAGTFTRDDLAHGVGADTIELAVRGREFVGGGALGTATPRVAWVRLVVDYTDPPDTIPPAVPTGLAARRGDTRVWLTWDANDEPDLVGYRLYRNGVQVYSGPALEFEDTGLTNGVEYSYTLSAYDDSDNESTQGAPLAVTPVVMRAPSSTLYPSATIFPGPAPVGGVVQSLAADIAGAGSVTTTLRQRSRVAASPAASTSFSAAARSRGQLTSNPGGAGIFGAALRTRSTLTSNVSGAGVMDASLAARILLTAAVASTGDLNSALSAKTFFAAAFGGTSELDSALSAKTFFAAAFGGTSDLDSALSAKTFFAAAFDGTGDLDSALSAKTFLTTAFEGTSDLGASLRARMRLLSAFDGASTLTGAVHTSGAFEVNIVAASEFTALLRARSRFGNANFIGDSGFATALRQRAFYTATFDAQAALSAFLETDVPYIHFKSPSDGEVIEVRADGSVVVRAADGSVVVVSGAGQIIEILAAGTVLDRAGSGAVIAPVLNGAVVGPTLHGAVAAPTYHGVVVAPIGDGSVVAVVHGGTVVAPIGAGTVVARDGAGTTTGATAGGTVAEPTADGEVADYAAGGDLA